ncbi:MAG: hypothetical protein J7M06_00085 [Proteobacteria bacterium]|nr:hypothetical protein [Pseudomonadota bacterium]
MKKDQNIEATKHKTPPLPQKIKLYLSALLSVPFYRYGEIGNIIYNIGKNILDGVILFTMFSMAEKELKVAAFLGVMVKYAYPGISLISSNLISGWIDRLESLEEIKNQVSKLIKVQVGIGIGQSMGAIFLLLCFPPVFKYFFYEIAFKPHIIVALYFLHHVFDGSGQIVEGRTWFKIIEIKIRNCDDVELSKNFWVIYILSTNFQLVLGQVFLWSALGLTAVYSSDLTAPVINIIVCFGLVSVVISKFILPVCYKLKLCS